MNTDPQQALTVEVVFATPEKQSLIELTVPSGTTAAMAIALSGIRKLRAELESGFGEIGIWGHPVEPGRELRDGDRVEIYRPLLMDPREARRQLAAHGKAMGQKD